MRYFGEVCPVVLTSANDCMDKQAERITTTYLESIGEEVYEYVWAPKDVKYRTGPNKSYKTAGTLEKETYVRRTGITHNGWSRITIEDKEYYVPRGKLSDEAPDWLPIASGAKGRIPEVCPSRCCRISDGLLPSLSRLYTCGIKNPAGTRIHTTNAAELTEYLRHCLVPKWHLKEATIIQMQSRR